MPEDPIREVEAAAILGVSHQRVNAPGEGKLVVAQATEVERCGKDREVSVHGCWRARAVRFMDAQGAEWLESRRNRSWLSVTCGWQSVPVDERPRTWNPRTMAVGPFERPLGCQPSRDAVCSPGDCRSSDGTGEAKHCHNTSTGVQA